MKQLMILIAVVTLVVPVMADTFGTGDNQFTIDFVTISGDASSANGTNIGINKPEVFFTDPGNYRMSTYEITNSQWTKFKSAYGTVVGTPTTAYDSNPYWTGENVPTNNVSWYEAAQFANWLNSSTGHQPAYKFMGTQGTSDYTLGIWDTTEAAGGTNLYRHKDAFYFLPTEDEWVKAAYWNGSSLQTWATIGDVSPTQGNGTSGTGWNYDNTIGQPWAVGSGSQELNGTFDMMGNVYELMESPRDIGDYLPGSTRGLRGGAYRQGDVEYDLSSSDRRAEDPYIERDFDGFRIASIPEPYTILLLSLGGLLIKK